MNIKSEDIINKLFETSSFEKIVNLIEKNNSIRIFVAGGVIRNYLIDPDIDIRDIDIFYSGNIESIVVWLKENGILSKGPFGSFRWFPSTEKSIYYDLISIDDFFHIYQCDSMNDVLNQFDVTVNCCALSLSKSSPELLINNNAIDDINNRIIRLVRFDFPDSPVSNEIALSRLAVLWFRILHYANKLNFNIEPKTFEWVELNKNYFFQKNEFSNHFFTPIIDENNLIQLGLK